MFYHYLAQFKYSDIGQFVMYNIREFLIVNFICSEVIMTSLLNHSEKGPSVTCNSFDYTNNITANSSPNDATLVS